MEVIYYSLIIRQTQQNGMLKCDGNKISWNFKIRKAFVMWNHIALNRHCGPHLGACNSLFCWFSKKRNKKKDIVPCPYIMLYLIISEKLSVCVCVHAQPCPILCDPMDCSPPGSSVHGILQARTLEWVAISSSRGSSWPRDQIHVSCVSCIGIHILNHCGNLIHRDIDVKQLKMYKLHNIFSLIKKK